MADSKWSEQKEEHLESKTKSWLPKRMNSDMERVIQESSWNRSEITEKPTPIINGEPNIKLRRFTEEEIDEVLKEIESRRAVRSTGRSLEDKIFWGHISPFMQRSLKTKHNRKIDEKLDLLLLQAK